jgi:flagellar hook-associated protein 1 FlgK
MSLNAILSNALSGLSVAQNALAVTANNVANVNTEGYSRQVAQQEAVVLDGRGAGARALPTTRAVDELLAGREREQAGRVGRSDVLDSLHAQIQERLFGAPGDAGRGLSARLTALATAAEALAGGPGEAGLAAGFLGAADALAREIRTAGAEVQALRKEMDARIAGTVATVNAALGDLAELNRALLRNGATPDLLDRRDRLLAGLATEIDLSAAFGEQGSVTLYTGGGTALLDGGPRRLVYTPAVTVEAGSSFGAIRVFAADEIDPATGRPLAAAVGDMLVSGGVRAELPPELLADAVPDSSQRIVSPLRSGRLQGLLEARDTVLPDLADELGELAETTRFALNAAHNSANARPPPGELLGTRADTGAFAVAARSGTGYVAVIDRATGAVAATVAVDVGAAADAADLTAQLAAGLGMYGSAGLAADGRLEIRAASGYALALSEGDSTITAPDAAGHVRPQGLAHFFGLNDLLVQGDGGPTDLRLRADLAADSSLLARARLDVEPGSPPTGQLGGAGDNRGAQALAAAFEATTTTVARGALPGGPFRLADYAAELVAVHAVAAERAGDEAASSRALAEDLATRRSAVSGVNLDEELSRLVLFQEAYSVSARVLAITNQLFDELLAVVD